MNSDVFKPDRWSERQQVLAIIVMASLVMFLLWYFLMLPQNRRRARMSKEVNRMRTELRQKNYFLGEPALRAERNREQETVDMLMREWEALSARLAAFPDQHGLAPSEVAHIDYKVALFEVRTRLLKKSREAGIGLPHDLGMNDEVASSEDARKLLLQLRSVEKMVDLALSMKISRLQNIDPLPPIEHATEGKGKAFLEEYPIRLEFFGTIESVYDLLERALRPDSMFVLRNLRVETPSREDSTTLRIRTTLGALVFMDKLDYVLGPPPVTRQRTVPMGH